MGKYDSIINLPHHVSETRPKMPLRDRAAQFAPFAALTGYDDAVEETARLTDDRHELEDYGLETLNHTLLQIAEQFPDAPETRITYFVPDTRKAGGSYVSITGRIKRIDSLNQVLVLHDGKKIAIGDVLNLEINDTGE